MINLCSLKSWEETGEWGRKSDEPLRIVLSDKPYNLSFQQIKFSTSTDPAFNLVVTLPGKGLSQPFSALLSIHV